MVDKALGQLKQLMQKYTSGEKGVKVGRFIRQIRSGLKMTRNQLAEKLGVKSSAVDGWENNRFKPSADRLTIIEELVQQSVGEPAKSKPKTGKTDEAGETKQKRRKRVGKRRREATGQPRLSLEQMLNLSIQDLAAMTRPEARQIVKRLHREAASRADRAKALANEAEALATTAEWLKKAIRTLPVRRGE